jgi:threonine/homoserine/homoserine lactone efflux protein
MAFIPQFLPVGSGIAQLLTLGLGFTGMTFAVFMGYTVLAATGRQRLLASERAMGWMRRAFAASFAALGLKLATETAR